MKKSFICIISILIFILDFYNCVYSLESNLKFSLSCTQDQICKDEEISVVLSVKPSAAVNISTFKLNLNFDKDILQIKDVTAMNPVNESEIKYNLDSSSVQVIFLTEDEGININENEKLCLIEFNFKALKSTGGNPTCISADIDGVGNYDEKYLNPSAIDQVLFEVLSLPRFDCRLKSLSTTCGQITPDFVPDTYDYEVCVASDVKEINFDSVPVDYSALVKVNRRKLKKPGEETVIKITVTSPDKKSKTVYRVKVKRDPKEKTESTKKSSTDNTKDKNSKNKKSKSNNKTTSVGKTNSPSSKVNLDLTDDDTNAKTIILRENGFSFMIFIIVAFAIIITSFFVWRKNKTFNKTNDEQKND